ncbi:DUF6477 family protein [Pararhodobacter sp. CCB-MM2]|uniref:DUF6477 family protein n=1 Tax=Pararhodobacter sp. CCB-MM2 TaxID=1786003 RepID=UPI000B2E9B67|nr:DUF6477 family protein [Pararhodobacter sp. CCB-MM2]
MSCYSTHSAMTTLAQLTTLRRPKLLLRSARFGTQDYRRETMLKRVLRLPATPAPGVATLRQLIALEARHEEARTLPPQEAGLPWRAAQHVEVLIALIAEARLLADSVTPPPPATDV